MMTDGERAIRIGMIASAIRMQTRTPEQPTVSQHDALSVRLTRGQWWLIQACLSAEVERIPQPPFWPFAIAETKRPWWRAAADRSRDIAQAWVLLGTSLAGVAAVLVYMACTTLN